MRLLIASDLHGSPGSAAFVLEQAHSMQPDACLLLGDLLYHGPRNPLPADYAPAETARLLGNIPVPLMALRGNCDAEVDSMVLSFPLVERAWLFADGLRILALHGHTLPKQPPFPGIAPGSVVLFGHTHVPVAHSAHGLHFWNPGSLTLPKEGTPPCYGWLENGVFSVRTRQGEEYLRHAPLNRVH